MTRSRPSFDRLAPIYHTLERTTYGSLLQWCRTVHLDRLMGSRRALILGDGDGRFIVELLKANQDVVVDSLDMSPRMLALASRRVAGTPEAQGRARFVLADARSAVWPDEKYDLIVTNFFLDCFAADELETLINRVATLTVPGGIWLDGDFRMPERGWARSAARVMLSGMYLFFAFATRLPASQLVEPAPFLAANGFTLLAELARLRGFLSSRIWVRDGSIANSNARSGERSHP